MLGSGGSRTAPWTVAVILSMLLAVSPASMAFGTPDAGVADGPPTGVAEGLLPTGADRTAPAALGTSGTAAGALGGYFEANHGQHPPHVRYAVRDAGTPAFITDRGAGFVVGEADPWAVFLEFAAPPAVPEPGTALPGRSHFLRGSDASQWHSDVPHFADVLHDDVWPGIDVQWHATAEGPKFDVIVSPGADPRLATFIVAGATGMTLEDGRLVMSTPNGRLVKDVPVAFQPGGGPVDVAYRITPAGFAFDIGAYDPALELVIDPLVYSTFVGGSNTNGLAYLGANAVDDAGSHYLAGETTDMTYPTTPGAYSVAMSGSVDVVVTKLDPTGSSLVYSTYIGGTIPASTLVAPWESIGGIAVDGAGHALITGVSGNEDYPVTPGAFQTVRGGGMGEAFVTKLTPAGDGLSYSTFLGGSSADEAADIALDNAGNAYVIGTTYSSDFPVTAGAYETTLPGGGDVFVTKLDPTGASALYSTFLGHKKSDWGTAIEVDAWDQAHLLIRTYSPDFPVTPGAPQPTMAGDEDMAVARLDATGSSLLSATFLGGTDQDDGAGIGVDHAGRSYIAGTTMSTDFPVTSGAYDVSFSGGYGDGFLTVWSANGLVFEYSTYFGGSSTDSVMDLAMNRTGIAYMVGQTRSADFPALPSALQPAIAGEADMFVTVMAPPWPGLVESTFLGGTADDLGRAIAVDEYCSAYVVGTVMSDDFPVTPGAYQTVRPGGDYPGDNAAAKMFHCAPPPTAAFDVAPDPVCYNQPVTVTFLGAPGIPRIPLASAWWDLGDGTTRKDAPPVDFTHTYTAPGSYPVALNVTDVVHVEARASGDVEAINCPPYLGSLQNFTVHQGEQVTFRVTGGDPNLDLDRIEAGRLPWGATFDPVTGIFSWTPTAPQRGTWGIDFTAFDPYGLMATGSMWIKVLEVPVETEAAVPDLPARMPRSSDADGDGMPDGVEACPAEAATAGSCNVVEAVFLERACKDLVPRPDAARAQWHDGNVEITWRHATPCPLEAYLVWNGTHELVAVVPADNHTVLDVDAWPASHRYAVQGVVAGQPYVFVEQHARSTNFVQAPQHEVYGPIAVEENPPRPVGALGEMVGVRLDAPPWMPLLSVVLATGLLATVLVFGRFALLRLFSRLDGPKALDHPVRAMISAVVAEHPGIHLTDLCARIGKASGVTRHHAAVLEGAGLLSKVRSRGYVCYYLPDTTPPLLKHIGPLIRSAAARQLLVGLVEKPGRPVAALAADAGVDPATARYHLRRFQESGLVRLTTVRGRTIVTPERQADRAIRMFT